MTKRNIMQAFKMVEISAVDRPAQIGARATIMKRDDRLPDRLGPPVDPKLHKRIEEMTVEEMQAAIAKAIADATAPLQAEITALKAAKKPFQPANGDDEPDADDEAKKAWRAYVAKQVEKAKAAMQVEFDKAAEIAKGDEVIKDEAGNELRKSIVGPQAFAFMKAQAEKIELEQFGKRAATEIPHLVGDVTLKAKCLRAVSKLDKDIKEGIEAMLKGGSAALKSMTVPAGVQVPDAVRTAEEQIDQLTKAYVEKSAGTSYADAYAKVLESQEGARLYNEATLAKRAAARG